MVDINLKRKPRRRIGGKSTSSSFFTIGRCRNLILLIILIQSSRMLAGFFFTNNESESSQPKGFIEKLEDSIVSNNHVRTGGKKSDGAPSNSKDTGSLSSSESKGEGSLPSSSRHYQIHHKFERNEHVTSDSEDTIAKSTVDFNTIVLNKKGTGPTKVGYVKDFNYERQNPVYRNLESTFMDSSATVAELVNEKSVSSCQNLNSQTSKNPKCSDPDTPLIAYNPESFVRTWCGQEIKPKSAVVMTEHCTDPIVHLLPAEIPPITGDHMPPITIKSKSGLDKELRGVDLEKVRCNIPCQQEKGLEFGKGTRYIDDEPWRITQTMGKASIERTSFKSDFYFSTQSLLSSVPLTNFDVKIHSLRNKAPVDFDTAKAKAIYIVDTDCSNPFTKRHRWFDGVKSKTPVDSYGNCAHNIEVPDGMTIATAEGRIALMKQYRIVLAFDNFKDKDHISSLIWEAFASGAVPVVVGADNIRDRLPPFSFINAADHNTWDGLANEVQKVISNKGIWESYHEWRKDDKNALAIDSMYEFAQTDPTCRLCRWAYAKKYGLGWDHSKQVIRSIPKIPKDKFCTTADHNLVSKPFVEQWVTKFGEIEKVHREDSEGESCSFLVSDGDIEVDSFKGHRKVFQHDSVTDFVITHSKNENHDASIILRLKFPGVRNPEGSCFYNTHTLVSTTREREVSSASIQDNVVKVTVIADWVTSVGSTDKGIMEIMIQKGSDNDIGDDSTPKRVRIIIEELSPIHDKMTEYLPSSFSKLMIKDFIDPLQVFFADS